MNKFTLALIILLLPWTVRADQPVDRQTVERLLEVTDAAAMVDQMHAQMDTLFEGMATQMEIREAERPVFESYMRKLTAAMKEEMSWEKMREPVIQIYMRNYTQKEAEDMLAFFATDSGQSMLRKMPVVMQESMETSQSMYQAFMPRLTALSKEFAEELRRVRKEQCCDEGTESR